MMKVKVKKGCIIYHKGQKYTEGDQLELSEASALVHGQNVELIKPEPEPELEPEPTEK